MAVYRHRGVVFDGKGAHGAHSGRRMEGKRKGEKRREKGIENGENEGNDQRERKREKKEGMRRGRIGRGFGMPRYRETEENESSAIGAYYGSHVLFW